MGQIQPPSDKNRAQNQQKSTSKEKSLEDKDTTRMEAKPQSAIAQKPQQGAQKQDTMRQSAASDSEQEDDLGEDAETMEAEGDDSGNEGEGSRSAARAYNQGLQQNMAKGQTEQQAKKAEQALDGPEGEELRRAEQAGKRGQPNKPH
jgi:hypothetical protein